MSQCPQTSVPYVCLSHNPIKNATSYLKMDVYDVMRSYGGEYEDLNYTKEVLAHIETDLNKNDTK